MNHMAILWGYAEVTPTKVTIMAEIAEKAEDIDVNRAQAAVEKAEQRLKAGGLPSEVKEAEISLEKARLRKRIAERSRRSSFPPTRPSSFPISSPSDVLPFD